MTFHLNQLNDQERTELRQALLAPRSVALIGASSQAGRVTSRPMQYLQQHGFRGQIFPINPSHGTVMGARAYASVSEVGQKIDHAYIMLNTDFVLEAFEQCVNAGVRVVTVLADGFAESGEQGQLRQRRLAALASDAGVLLLGPNSMGTVDLRSGFVCTTNAAFASDMQGNGRTAVISQSGSLIGTILSRGQARGLSYCTFISTGNEANTGVGELGQLLVDDPGIDNFTLFLETLRDVDSIRAFAQQARLSGKPIVAYMTGLSEEGQALATSHTGALVGQRAAADSFLKQIGIHRVGYFESLLEAPQALCVTKPTREVRGVTVISTTGGGGAMVIDQMSLRGVPILQPSDRIRRALVELNLPQGHGKLIDVTLAGARYEVMKAVLDTIINDSGSGIIVVAIGSSAQFNPEVAVRPVIDACNEANTAAAARVVAFPIPQADQSLRLLADAGVPAFRTVESCAECVSLMLASDEIEPLIDAYAPAIGDSVHEIRQRSTGATLNEIDASRIIESLGIPAPASVVLALDEPVPTHLPFDYPCVVKLISADVTHKTDAGAVRLGIDNHADLSAAILQMTASFRHNLPHARLEGILVQAMQHGVAELLVGATRDPIVGPIITVGMGGKLTELFRDTATRPAPVSRSTATNMLAELRLFPLLSGYRGEQAGDIDAAADAIAQVSQLLTHEFIAEVEINPLLVRQTNAGVVLLDALVRLSDADDDRDVDRNC